MLNKILGAAFVMMSGLIYTLDNTDNLVAVIFAWIGVVMFVVGAIQCGLEASKLQKKEASNSEDQT